MSDLALMEAVAGSISRVDFATHGDLQFSFARDLTNIARSVIHASNAKESTSSDAFLGLGLHANDMSQDGFSHNSSYLEVSLSPCHSSIRRKPFSFLFRRSHLLTFETSAGHQFLQLGELRVGFSISGAWRRGSARIDQCNHVLYSSRRLILFATDSSDADIEILFMVPSV